MEEQISRRFVVDVLLGERVNLVKGTLEGCREGLLLSEQGRLDGLIVFFLKEGLVVGRKGILVGTMFGNRDGRIEGLSGLFVGLLLG